MAQAPAKNETTADAPAPAPARRGSKLLLIIVLIAVLLLLIAVVGIGALLIMKKGGGAGNGTDTPDAVPPPPPVAAAAATAFDINKPPVFVQLDPFTVNLRMADDDDNHYLQAVIALRVRDAKTADALKGWMHAIRDSVNATLSSKLPAEVQTGEGRRALANEILTQLNTLLGVPPPPPDMPQMIEGPIQAVLFSSFIIQ